MAITALGHLLKGEVPTAAATLNQLTILKGVRTQLAKQEHKQFTQEVMFLFLVGGPGVRARSYLSGEGAFDDYSHQKCIYDTPLLFNLNCSISVYLTFC